MVTRQKRWELESWAAILLAAAIFSLALLSEPQEKLSSRPISPRGPLLREEEAARAGILPTRYDEDGNVILEDIIVAIDSQPLRSTDDLYKILDNHQVGDEVQVEVNRGGRRRTVTVKLQAI